MFYGQVDREPDLDDPFTPYPACTQKRGATGTEDIETVKLEYGLTYAWPNPSNPKVRIHYTIADEGPVRLVAYNLKGQLVRTLVDGDVPPGRYSVVWAGVDERGRHVASGVYFVKLEASDFAETRRLVILR
jgi:hypothetical protein